MDKHQRENIPPDGHDILSLTEVRVFAEVHGLNRVPYSNLVNKPFEKVDFHQMFVVEIRSGSNII